MPGAASHFRVQTRPTETFKRNLVPAKAPMAASQGRKVQMNAGSIAIPYYGNGKYPDDDGENENGQNIGNQFFRDIFGSLTKDQKKQMAESFKNFQQEEQAQLAQQPKDAAGRFQSESTVIEQQQSSQAYQAAVAQDQDFQLLGAAQMINEVMLDSTPVRSDESMRQTQL